MKDLPGVIAVGFGLVLLGFVWGVVVGVHEVDFGVNLSGLADVITAVGTIALVAVAFFVRNDFVRQKRLELDVKYFEQVIQSDIRTKMADLEVVFQRYIWKLKPAFSDAETIKRYGPNFRPKLNQKNVDLLRDNRRDLAYLTKSIQSELIILSNLNNVEYIELILREINSRLEAAREYLGLTVFFAVEEGSEKGWESLVNILYAFMCSEEGEDDFESPVLDVLRGGFAAEAELLDGISGLGGRLVEACSSELRKVA